MLPFYADSKTVGVYADLPNELPTSALISRLLEDGKHVYLPRCEPGASRSMRFVRCFSSGTNDISTWPRGKYGIREPTGPETTEGIDLLVLPGVAFDPRTFARLGQGAGYYDRWIQAKRGRDGPGVGRCVGVCMDCQVVKGVPFEEHDVVMDGLVWPGGGVKIREGWDAEKT